MTSKVAIQIYSKQTYETNVDEIEQSYEGTMILKEKEAFISYDEYEGNSKIETLISVGVKEPNKEHMYIHKEGAMLAQLLFIPYDISKARYRTPMGVLEFDILVKRLHVELGEKTVIESIYQLCNNGEKVSDNFFKLIAQVINK